MYPTSNMSRWTDPFPPLTEHEASQGHFRNVVQSAITASVEPTD